MDDPLARVTLALLDGTRDRTELGAGLQAWLVEQHAAGSAPEGASPDDITPAAIEAKLLELARLGLFVA